MQLARLFRIGRFTDARRANVSVEFALVSVMVLLPLVAGGSDFMELISAKSALNTALQSMYGFAWNSPASATNITELAGILSLTNQHSVTQVTFPDGVADKTTTYTPAVSYGCSATPGSAVTTQNTPCATGLTQETFITYNIIAKVNMMVPMPFGIPNPYTLTASGVVETQ